MRTWPSFLLAIVAACVEPSMPTASSDALVVRGGALHTMDPARPRAEMAVVERGKFTCVGATSECGARAPANARVIELRGGSATPGLADAHGHVVSYGRSVYDVALYEMKSEDDAARALAERAKASPMEGVGGSSRSPAGPWILGRGWNQTQWPGTRFPTEASLSKAVPDRPVFATRVDGHAAWVNARALALAGITRDTPDPQGGKILRAPDGAPTGVLLDNAMELVSSKIPPLSPTAIEEAILSTQKKLLASGITSVHDAGVGAAALDVYRQLANTGKLRVRIYAMLDGQQPLDALRAQMTQWKTQGAASDRLTVRAVKLYADGAMGSRGALMFEPYADDPTTSGIAVTERKELHRRILEVARAGYQPAVHAIGDRACAETLADFVEASRLAPDLRPRVEHLQVLLPRDVHLLRDAGAIASMQPTHATSDSPWADARLGANTDRSRGAYAWRTILDAQVPLACGSDFPVEDLDPRAGLYAAETRAWHHDQRMTRAEALRCFTAGAAFAEHAEQRRGMIKEGYDADLTAFARDVMSVGADELRSLEVTATIIGGAVEYVRP